jgi:hypothetical protein
LDLLTTPYIRCAVTVPSVVVVMSSLYSMYLYDSPVNAWGARVLCHERYGAPIADFASMSTALGNKQVATSLPVLSNSTFWSYEYAQVCQRNHSCCQACTMR